MVKKVVAGVCLCFVFIMFACASLAAQGPQIAIVQRSLINCLYGDGKTCRLNTLHEFPTNVPDAQQVFAAELSKLWKQSL